MDIENFVHYAASSGPVFFERGVLDSLWGLDHITPLNESELSMWLSKYKYFSKVFVLPPWKAIYENDAERDHTFEHAESVNRATPDMVAAGDTPHRRRGCTRTPANSRPPQDCHSQQR